MSEADHILARFLDESKWRESALIAKIKGMGRYEAGRRLVALRPPTNAWEDSYFACRGCGMVVEDTHTPYSFLLMMEHIIELDDDSWCEHLLVLGAGGVRKSHNETGF